MANTCSSQLQESQWPTPLGNSLNLCTAKERDGTILKIFGCYGTLTKMPCLQGSVLQVWLVQMLPAHSSLGNKQIQATAFALPQSRFANALIDDVLRQYFRWQAMPDEFECILVNVETKAPCCVLLLISEVGFPQGPHSRSSAAHNAEPEDLHGGCKYTAAQAQGLGNNYC